MQTVYAIAYAEKEIGFTHYDLHDENVLIKKLGEYKDVQYYGRDNNIVYFNTNSIPVIIDYGFSTMNTNGRKCGIRIDGLGIFDIPFALYDCWRLLFVILLATKRIPNTQGIYNKFVPLIGFFGITEHELMRLMSEAQYSFSKRCLPRGHLIRYTAYDFIDFVLIKTRIKGFSHLRTSSPLYTMINNGSKTMDAYISNPFENVHDVFKFYNLKTFLLKRFTQLHGWTLLLQKLENDVDYDMLRRSIDILYDIDYVNLNKYEIHNMTLDKRDINNSSSKIMRYMIKCKKILYKIEIAKYICFRSSNEELIKNLYHLEKDVKHRMMKHYLMLDQFIRNLILG